MKPNKKNQVKSTKNDENDLKITSSVNENIEEALSITLYCVSE